MPSYRITVGRGVRRANNSPGLIYNKLSSGGRHKKTNIIIKKRETGMQRCDTGRDNLPVYKCEYGMTMTAYVYRDVYYNRVLSTYCTVIIIIIAITIYWTLYLFNAPRFRAKKS